MNWNGRIIDHRESTPYLKNESGDLSALAAALVEHQKHSWPLLAEGYSALKDIETRSVKVAESDLVIQHNPRRIVSTGARVDRASIASRRCFLCAANLPPEEKGIAYSSDFVILCNPFPILDRHLSIVHREHVVQQIESNIELMLALARDLSPDHFVLYNGPECGASAPDHLHFQACSRALLPIEDDLKRRVPESNEGAMIGEGVELFTLTGIGRSIIVFRGSDSSKIARSIYRTLTELSRETDKAEPMINIICAHTEGEWTVYLFPRARHRPACYFAEGEDRLTVSPGAIDMAGVIVVPDSRDFARIDAVWIERIFSEVSLSEETTRRVIEKVGLQANEEEMK